MVMLQISGPGRRNGLVPSGVAAEGWCSPAARTPMGFVGHLLLLQAPRRPPQVFGARIPLGSSICQAEARRARPQLAAHGACCTSPAFLLLAAASRGAGTCPRARRSSAQEAAGCHPHAGSGRAAPSLCHPSVPIPGTRGHPTPRCHPGGGGTALLRGRADPRGGKTHTQTAPPLQTLPQTTKKTSWRCLPPPLPFLAPAPLTQQLEAGINI